MVAHEGAQVIALRAERDSLRVDNASMATELQNAEDAAFRLQQSLTKAEQAHAEQAAKWRKELEAADERADTAKRGAVILATNNAKLAAEIDRLKSELASSRAHAEMLQRRTDVAERRANMVELGVTESLTFAGWLITGRETTGIRLTGSSAAMDAYGHFVGKSVRLIGGE